MFVSAIGGLKLVEDEEDDRVGKPMWIITIAFCSVGSDGIDLVVAPWRSGWSVARGPWPSGLTMSVGWDDIRVLGTGSRAGQMGHAAFPCYDVGMYSEVVGLS
jgi:hypothetical protein